MWADGDRYSCAYSCLLLELVRAVECCQYMLQRVPAVACLGRQLKVVTFIYIIYIILIYIYILGLVIFIYV